MEHSIKIIKRKGIKRLTIRITADGTIRVSAPKYATKIVINNYIKLNQTWIINSLHKLGASNPSKLKIIKNHHPIGQVGTIVLMPSNTTSLRLKFSASRFLLTIHSPDIINNQLELKSKVQEQALEKKLKFALTKLGNSLLLERLNICADIIDQNINSSTVKAMKSRWGSCQKASRHIVLNCWLLLLPQEERDYVIFHELTHLTHANHSAEFWTLLDSYIPRSKKLAKQVRYTSPSLNLIF